MLGRGENDRAAELAQRWSRGSDQPRKETSTRVRLAPAVRRVPGSQPACQCQVPAIRSSLGHGTLWAEHQYPRPPRWWDRGRRQTDGGQRHAGHAAFGAAAISASAVAVHPLDTVKHSSSFQLGSGSWWTGSGRFWPCRFGRLLRDVGRKKIRRD